MEHQLTCGLVLLFGFIFLTVTNASPPRLPSHFFGSFLEYEAPNTTSPPYVNGLPEAPFQTTQGAVFYDWSLEAMVEERFTNCVNIFPSGNNFPCTFYNVNATSYLVTSGPNTPFAPCCIFAKPFHPPRPDFLKTSVHATELHPPLPWAANQIANWYIVKEIRPPTGPFFYAFLQENVTKATSVYSGFSFPGIHGWVQQNFFNITYAQPNATKFILPDSCDERVIKSC